MSDVALDYVLPLLAESAIALGVLLAGLAALRRGNRWAVWAVVAGAVWVGVQTVYVADYLAVEAGSTGVSDALNAWHWVEVLRWLRLTGLALLVPAVWLAHLPADDRIGPSDHARSGV